MSDRPYAASRDEGVKILWISDTTPQQMAKNSEDQDLIYENMLEYVRAIARHDTHVDVHFVQDSAGEAFSPWLRYPRALLAVEMVERVRQAERDGYDAAFPGMCFGEFFLEEARQAVTMPVVGAAESSMSVAQLLGRKFAVVTTFQRFERPIDDRLRAHRWESRAISNRPVRSYTPELSKQLIESYLGRPEQMIEEFDQHAQECVREGADVVICGCNPLGAALSKAGYKEVIGTGVPVVTALSSMIKQAEMLVDLKRSIGLTKSDAMLSPYMSTPTAVLADLEERGIGMKPSHPIGGRVYST
jgi:allantoin racemase